MNVLLIFCNSKNGLILLKIIHFEKAKDVVKMIIFVPFLDFCFLIIQVCKVIQNLGQHVLSQIWLYKANRPYSLQTITNIFVSIKQEDLNILVSMSRKTITLVC